VARQRFRVDARLVGRNAGADEAFARGDDEAEEGNVSLQFSAFRFGYSVDSNARSRIGAIA
jgi:hypothetical protein